MTCAYQNLTRKIRRSMLKEVEYDIDRGSLHLSSFFNPAGKIKYPEILKSVALTGDETALAHELITQCCFREYDDEHPTEDGSLSKISCDACLAFAEDEFRRFYLRALCNIAIAEGRTIEIYSEQENEDLCPESQDLIGLTVDPYQLLQDMRKHIAFCTALWIAEGPASGLSVRIRE